MHAISSVHFGKNFENAMWDPVNHQMVYGDGGELLFNFTKCMDVVGHEMTHGVTVHTSPLVYEGESGAINEHISDVFGIMIKQWVDGTKSAEADWLIGEGCFLPDQKGVALRSMKAPGTAYDDPRFSKDPQPDHMSGYKDIEEDFGGAHINSGILNKAFYLVATALGGHSWDKAGPMWWKTMTDGVIPHRCTFVEFANATVTTAEKWHGKEVAAMVRSVWNEVGIVDKSHCGCLVGKALDEW